MRLSRSIQEHGGRRCGQLGAVWGLPAPAAVFIFGGLHNVPTLFWVWMVSLNAFVGVACAVWYLRVGIGGAILVHFGTDLVWHVLSQLF
jgi:hypothetical protein